MANVLSFAMQPMENDEYELVEFKLNILNSTKAKEDYLKSQIERFVFSQFVDVKDLNIRWMILESILSYEPDVIEVNHALVDIMEMLNSVCTKEREMAILLVEHFFSFYECDQRIMFALRKNKRIRKLMANNPTYKSIFKITEEPVKATDISRKSKKHAFKLSDAMMKYKEGLDKCKTFTPFMALLKLVKEEELDCKLKIIVDLFLQKAQKQELRMCQGIHAIQLQWMEQKEEGLDHNIQKDFYGLEYTDDYMFLKHIFFNIKAALK